MIGGQGARDFQPNDVRAMGTGGSVYTVMSGYDSMDDGCSALFYKNDAERDMDGCAHDAGLRWTVTENEDGTFTVTGMTRFELERSIDVCWGWASVEED